MSPPPPDVENHIEVSLIKLMQEGSAPPPLSFPEISHGFPIRGLFLSAIAHELIFVVILLLSFSLTRSRFPASRTFNGTIKLSDAKGVIYLPVLGGGSEGGGTMGGAAGAPIKELPPVPSRSSKGMAFPGPQPILSSPPDPTNQRQTIIQPAQEKPKILQEFVPLPNMVKIAKPHLALPPDVTGGKPELPEFHPALQAAVQPPRVVLPATPPPATPPPAPIRPAAEAPKRASGDKVVEPPKLKPSQTMGADEQAMVSLSPTPTLPQEAPQIPEGEARGQFAVSPSASLTPAPVPGSKIESSAPAPAIGQTGAAAGDAAGPATTGGGGLGTGAGADNGSGKGGTATAGTGRGSSAGPKIGNGPGPTSASGSGAGNASGKGGLAGLTIQAKSYGGSGISVNNGGGGAGGGIGVSVERSAIKLPPQTAYGMTISSTADSGGGLPDLGVFAHEKIYTVFLDMRGTSSDRTPSWTLQYARLRSAADKDATPHPEGITPPYPLAKELPRLNAELIRTYLRNVIVVFAIMDTEGNLQRISVLQTPDTRFNPPILAALAHWKFQPAQLGGQPVPLKILIGIPLLPYE